jgi:peptidoglycan/xylan/chitin deacetylase (PgdA/CDA1 family)
VSGALRDAVLLSFDNLGEAADLQRYGAQASGPHPSVTVGLPRALDALAALDLRATFFVEGLNAELYPKTLRDIAAAGHEVGLHGWRHEVWDSLAPAEEDELLRRGMAALATLGLEVEGFRPPGGALGPRTLDALAAHGLRWCSPAGEHVGRTGGIACLPFRWRAVDAYHRLESFTDRRKAWGDRADVASPTEAADALIGAIDARGDEPLVLILHPFLMLEDSEAAQARRVLEHLAEQVVRGARWVAPGRALAALVGEDVPCAS